MEWVQFKLYLSEITDLDQDALHIYAAFIFQFALALLLRKPVSHPLPWIGLLVVLIANEAVDLIGPGEAVQEWQVLGGLRDLWNTMVLPTALLLLARYAPSLLTAPPGSRSAGRIEEHVEEPDS